MAFDFTGIDNKKSSTQRNSDIIRNQIHNHYKKQHIEKINALHTDDHIGRLTITDMVLRDQYWYITRINDPRANALTLPTMFFTSEVLTYFLENNIRFNKDVINEKFNVKIEDMQFKLIDTALHGKFRNTLFTDILDSDLYNFKLHIFLKNFAINKLGVHKDIEKICNKLAKNNGFFVMQSIYFLSCKNNDKFNINISQPLKIENCLHLKDLTITVTGNNYNPSIALENLFGLEKLTIKDPNKLLRTLDVSKVPNLKELVLPEDLNTYSTLIGTEVNKYFGFDMDEFMKQEKEKRIKMEEFRKNNTIK